MKYFPGVLFLIMIFSAALFAGADKPEISGNYEQGSRYEAPNEEYFWDAYTGDYDDTEDDNMYSFRKGHVQLKQDLSEALGYSVRLSVNLVDFPGVLKDNERRYLITSFKYGFNRAADLKMGFYYREQNYPDQALNTGGNVINAPFLELRYKLRDDLKFIMSYRHKLQDFSAASNISQNKKVDFMTLGIESSIKEVALSFRYKIDYRSYAQNSSLNNSLKDSFSVGFRYKFR